MLKNREPTPRNTWAYAYLIVPALTRMRMKPIRALLDGENQAAQDARRVWNGRVICERRITRILIVSDSPSQEGDINRRIEAEVELMDAQCYMTRPLATRGYPDGIDAPDPRGPARN